MRPSPEPSREHVEVVRSEEELVVGRVRVPTERVRVRKVIETEEVTMTVVVRREVLVVERELLADGAPLGADATADAPLELVLHAEEPVVSTRVVPVERVRVAKRLITEERRVVDEVRSEQVVLEQEGDAEVGRAGPVEAAGSIGPPPTRPT
jgi:uncharacterized protein (TIGR02271 family)